MSLRIVMQPAEQRRQARKRMIKVAHKFSRAFYPINAALEEINGDADLAPGLGHFTASSAANGFYGKRFGKGERMISIWAMVALTLLLIACVTVSVRKARLIRADGGRARRPSLAALAVPLLYVPLLIIAARFGARTFPGIWTPNNPIVNDITQGGFFYLAAAAAIVCGAIDLFLVVSPTSPRGCLNRSLVWTRRLLLTVIMAVCIYGFTVAIYLERLP